MAKAAALRKPKKKVNPLDKEGIAYIDYKDTALLRKFISDRGKIRARRVTGLSTPGDVVEVRGGYGRNYLLPQGFAIPWTKGAEKQIVLIKRARSAREIRDLGHASEVKAQLEALTIKLAVRAGGAAK